MSPEAREDRIAIRLPGAVTAALGLAALMALSSCGPRADRAEPLQTPSTPPAPPVRLDAADAVALIEAHNRRVELLSTTWARGVIEFRWRDESGGEHFEPQVNARLWLDLPRRTALRAEKFDDVLLWLGSDDQHYWMFDLMSEETVLYVGRHAGAAPEAGRSPLLIRPLALVDLLGLMPIPVPEIGDASPDAPGWLSFDADRDACIIDAPGGGGPMRVYLDRSSGLPMRVETLSRDGQVLLFSELGRYTSVPVPGTSRAALPKMPTLIDLADPEGTVSVKLALDQPSGDIEDQPWDRVFALSRLLDALRPDRIEGDVMP